MERELALLASDWEPPSAVAGNGQLWLGIHRVRVSHWSENERGKEGAGSDSDSNSDSGSGLP